MILSGKSIIKEIENGNIVISDYDASRLNPNSYNVRLADELLTYDPLILDMKCRYDDTNTQLRKIPEEGFVMLPGVLYLGRTMEKTETYGFVPMLEGRSSVGRLGIFVHATAGFGDNGFKGYWTLELSCVQPVRIYAGVEIAQVYFHTIEEIPDFGAHNIATTYIHGKYQNNDGIQPSMLWKDFNVASSPSGYLKSSLN